MSLKQLFKKNQVSVGSWLTIGHPSIAEMMCQVGFDWLVIDMEHSAITLSEAQTLIQVIDLSNVAPLVRVGHNDSTIIKRVMDAGAHGVIVPMVNTKEDAEKAVKAVKYPPNGDRGVGLARAQGYGQTFEQYKEWVDKESIVIVQIEHINAVHNLEEILSVEGVDGFIVGPYDLSGSLGAPGEFEKIEVINALNKIKEIMEKTDKIAGFHVVSNDEAKVKEKINEGYKFVAYSLDTLFLFEQAKRGLCNIRTF